eukprot:384574_1
MYGPEGAFNAQQSGIVPRAISMLFQCLEDDDNIMEFTIKVSFIEIYLERMHDLLNIKGDKNTTKASKKGKKKNAKKIHKSAKQKQAEKDANKLRIRTLPNGSTIIQNLYEEECESLMDVLGLIQKATNNRTTSSTTMNSTSSRSHLVMMTHVEQKMQDGSTRLSNLNFADLAGSEKVKKTEASGTRLEEAKQINKSLTQLGIVIRALSEKKSFISFRDSILTHILKDSLGGNTKTTLLCTCSPHIFNRDESISTLRFATRTKLISNVVYKNTVLSAQQMTKLIKNLRTEIVDLKQRLQDKVIKELGDEKERQFAMEKSATHMDPALQKKVIDDLKNYKRENIKLQQDQKKAESKEAELQKLVAQLRSEIEDWKEKHQNVLMQIDTISSDLDANKKSNAEKDKLIQQLQDKITELNGTLLESANEKNKASLQLEFLSTIYANKLKRVEQDEKEMRHQLSLVRQNIEQNKAQVDRLKMARGHVIDMKTESKVIGLKNETRFYEEQETRLKEVLNLFKEEKSLLVSKDDTLTEQLKNLQKYLNLKDTQIKDLRAQLNGCDDKLKLKELQITRCNTSVQQLNETVKDLQDQNSSLEKKIKAYFSFRDKTGTTPVPSPTPQEAIPVWQQATSRHRGASAFSPKTRARRNSDHKKAGDNLLMQQEYLAAFARLRAQREKERLEKEREERQRQEEEALKKLKAEEVAKAAAERERKKKAAQEAEERKKRKKEQESEERVKRTDSGGLGTPISASNGPMRFPKRSSTKDKGTINTYRRKGKKPKRWKSSRSKVQALVSGFEQIEDNEDVFGVAEDDAAMMLRLLDQSAVKETDPRKWTVDDVMTWLKSIDLGMYADAFKINKIDGGILYNDITEIKHLTDLTVAEFHAHKLLREINILRKEQKNAELDDVRSAEFDSAMMEEENKIESVDLDPFEMIRDLFADMDEENKGYIDRDAFTNALAIADVTTLDEDQIDMVYNQFHFSSEAGITEEEMLLSLGKVFVQHHCTDAKMAFRLACVIMLQNTGMIAGYADNLEDLFENVAEVQKNLIEWQQSTNGVQPFFEEKLMKLMKMAGSKVCVIDGKRVRSTEEYDDMHCARMAGDGVHLSVIKIWWAFSTIHGIQSTYTSMDGKHFTSIRHASNLVSDETDTDLHESIILLKHDEFIKYVSVSATNLVHNITVVTTLGKRYECGHNRGDQIIQYKPPALCGVLAFYGSVTHRGLSAVGCYVVKNEKIKLKMAFKKGIQIAHFRAQLRQVLKGKLNKGINLEEAIGFLLGKYDELNVRRICEATDKNFVKEIVEECNKVCKPASMTVMKAARRKLTALRIQFSGSIRSLHSTTSVPLIPPDIDTDTLDTPKSRV